MNIDLSKIAKLRESLHRYERRQFYFSPDALREAFDALEEFLNRGTSAAAPHDHNTAKCETCKSADQYAKDQYRAYDERIAKVKALVNEQAADEGLWSFPIGRSQNIVEAYLQKELRRLHAAIEEGL